MDTLSKISGRDHITQSQAMVSTLALVPLLLSIISRTTEAHTWIDCIDTDRSKIYDQSTSYIFGGAGGNGFCEGYGAGYPGRGDIDIGTGYTYKMLKNEVEAGTPVCQTVAANTYSDWRKRITLAPGETAYFAYLPNGHIVKDKKAIGTQHGVYWTGQVGTSLTSTLDMKPENLMDGHTMNYDDGNCGETVDYYGNPGGRAGDGKPCVGSFVVPAGTAPGIYNMVWYWTFWLDDQAAYVDQTQAKGYFGAAYSTCFEMEVTAGGAATSKTGVVPAVTPAPPAAVAAAPAPAAAPASPATPTPVAKTAEHPIVGAAAPMPAVNRAEVGTVAPAPGKYGMDDVATVHPAIDSAESSSSSSTSTSDDGSSTSTSASDTDSNSTSSSGSTGDDEVGQIEPATEGSEDSSSGSTSRSGESAQTMDSAAGSIETIERWMVLGFALLFGTLL